MNATIKIGTDTKDFIGGLKKADKSINSTAKLGNQLNKSLKVEYNSTVAVEAQKQLQKALTETEKKAQDIRDQLKKLEDSGRMDTIDYQTLQTELAKADSNAVKLKKSLEEAKNVKIEELSKKFKDVGSDIENAGKKLAPFSAAAAGVIAGMGAVAKKAADLGGDIDEMSERFDVSTDTIQRWSYLSIQSGVEANTFSKALIRMRAAVSDMAAGTSNKSTDILQSLGISPENFKNSEDMFDGIMSALRAVEDSTLQTAYANEIFGDKIANDMLPYIKIADETLAQYNSEFDAMPTLTAEQVKVLDHLSDSFTRFTTTMQYSAAQMGVALAPIMERVLVLVEEKLVPAIQKLADWFDNLSPGMQDTILVTLGIIAALAPLLILIGKVSTGIGALIPLLAKLRTVSLSTAAGFAALGGALALGLNLIFDWKNMSAIEKILKSLAVAALVAAAAITVFHASWSLGIAIGAIAAGIAVGIAAIKAASEDIGVDAGINADGTASGGTGISNSMTEKDTDDINSWTQQANQSAAASNNYQHTENVSNDTYYITIEANDYTSPQEVADLVSKQIATLSKARG